MKKHSRFISILLALLVTVLWSSSFVIIKIGLDEIPPLLFAGLRYFIAAMCFIPLLMNKERQRQITSLSKREWKLIVYYGFVFIALTQGLMFLALSLLPSVTVSLILNFTPVIVAIMGIYLIKEFPTKQQWFGTGLFIVGILVYFLPSEMIEGKFIGILVMISGVFANSGATVLGRSINRGGNISPIVVTSLSMIVGSIILLSIGLVLHGLPEMSLTNFLLLLWMAIINTAFAFTLWNKTMQSLSAMEISIINGTMLIQIAVLAWIFLGEEITLFEGIGMLIAAIGALLVQLKKRAK
jgi:drug/metabolite transporter (DMT)-like permease